LNYNFILVWDKPKPAVQVKQEVIVKDEPGVETDCSKNDVVNLLKAEQPTLILLQPADNRCRLADLEEGRIGSLRVHQSGREAVAVTSDEASRSADIVSLGALQHKLNLMPDWETMFCDMPV
ncbi:hypothetical protein MSG28_011682, partial [Choristoneura fumiferana]